MKQDDVYTIGEVADLLNIQINEIRHLEYEDLINPSATGEYEWNLYSKEDITKLRFILSMKTFGYSSEDIKEEMLDN